MVVVLSTNGDFLPNSLYVHFAAIYYYLKLEKKYAKQLLKLPEVG